MSLEGMEDSLTREEAKRILRRLELDAYSSMITAFRAQGDLSREKKLALSDLATHLCISTERHRAEVRRVVNDNRLNAVAECMYGPGTETEWSTEGRRLVSLTPRLVPQTAFTAKASHSANTISTENLKSTNRRTPLQNVKDKTQLAGSVFTEKVNDKNQGKDGKSAEPTRSASTSSNSSVKSQDGEKMKKKKKANAVTNKVLKPSKLNLQSKPDLKSSSAPIVSRSTTISPLKIHKSGSSIDSPIKFHQKPLILQRSPQKTSSTIKPEIVDIKLAAAQSNFFNVTSKSHSPGNTLNPGFSSPFGQRALPDNPSSSSIFQPASTQGILTPNASPLVQKMRFKTPLHKNRLKPTKPRTFTHIQHPSCVIVSSGNSAIASDTLNALGASTVVPMAPISPVKPQMPSAAANMLQGKACSVKVVQVQKANVIDNNQIPTTSLSSKSLTTAASVNSTKLGSAQRLLALSNVPITGNQQLKIASIPNVLQQSGAKIVSVAKSVPMTTGFKMIAVTTVVPGSTQVKTVYIATPIMSVTKNTSTTVASQVLSSFQITQTKSAQTFISPSNSATLGKPSVGLLNSRGYAPVVAASKSLTLSTSVFSNPASKSVITALSSASVAAKVISCTDAANSNRTVKKLNDKSLNTAHKSLVTSPLVTERKQNNISSTSHLATNSRTNPETASNSSLMTFKSKGRDFIADKSTVKNMYSSSSNGGTTTVFVASNMGKSSNDNTKGLIESAKNYLDINSTSNVSKNVQRGQPASDSADESILLAGEQFLAELAAKFSQHTSDKFTPSVCSSSEHTDQLLTTVTSTAGNQIGYLQKEKGFNSVSQKLLENFEAVEKKVIVRKIEDEYNPLIRESPRFDIEGNCTIPGDQHMVLNPNPSIASESSSSCIAICDVNLKSEIKTETISNKLIPLDEANTYQSFTSPIESKPRSKTLNNQEAITLQVVSSSSKLNTYSFPTDNVADAAITKTCTNFLTVFNQIESVNAVSPIKHPNLQQVQDFSFTKNSVSTGSVFSNSSKLKNGPFESSIDSTVASNVFSVTSTIATPLPVVQPHVDTDASHTPIMNSSPYNLEESSKKKFSAVSKCDLFDDCVNSSNSNNQNPATTPSRLSHPAMGNGDAHLDPKLDEVEKTSGDTLAATLTPRFTSPLNSPSSFTNLVHFPPDTVIEDRQGVDKSHDSSSKPALQLDSHVCPDHDDKQKEMAASLAYEGRFSQQSALKNELQVPLNRKTNRCSQNTNVSKPAVEAFGIERVTVASPPNAGGSPNSKANIMSNSKKRKADHVSRTLASWTRGAMILLQKVSRFRGPNKQKGEMNAASWFTRPVSPEEAPGYYKVIKKPMDLGTIKKRLEGGVYKDSTEFYADMHLIKSNCYTYNPADHIVRKDCDLVFAFFEEEYYKLLKKWQSPSGSPNKKTRLAACPESTM